MKKILVFIIIFALVLSNVSALADDIDPNERIAELEEQVATLEEQVKEKDRRIAELENQVNVLLNLMGGSPSKEKSDSVINVETLISSIGEINFDSGDIIAKAEAEYRYLSENDQSLVSNYGDLQRAKDKYNDFLEEIVIGSWESEIWKDHLDGTLRVDIFTFNKGGGGTFTEYNYYDREKFYARNVSLTWTLNDKYVMCELAGFFGMEPRTFEIREIDGNYCLIRMIDTQERNHWKQ